MAGWDWWRLQRIRSAIIETISSHYLATQTCKTSNIKKHKSYKVRNIDSGIENASCVNNLIAWVNVTWSLIKYHIDIIDAKCS